MVVFWYGLLAVQLHDRSPSRPFSSRREAVMVSEALASLRLFVIADRRPSGVGVETVGISAPAAAAFCNTSSQFAAEPAVH